MSEQRRRPGERAVWPWWKRLVVKALRFAFGWMLNRQGTALSWSALALTAALVVELWRLSPQPWENNLRIVPAIGWPDVFLFLLILWGRWIDTAAQTVAERNPDKIVDTLLPKLLDRMGVGQVAQAAPFVPHQWREGDPDEGVI